MHGQLYLDVTNSLKSKNKELILQLTSLTLQATTSCTIHFSLPDNHHLRSFLTTWAFLFLSHRGHRLGSPTRSWCLRTTTWRCFSKTWDYVTSVKCQCNPICASHTRSSSFQSSLGSLSSTLPLYQNLCLTLGCSFWTSSRKTSIFATYFLFFCCQRTL